MLMLQHNGLAEYADPGENAIRAVAAGSDLLLYVLPTDPAEFGISVEGLADTITAAVADGRIPPERLEEAAIRVMELRRELSVDRGE
jgi:beta-N-acetylhexosaminidase